MMIITVITILGYAIHSFVTLHASRMTAVRRDGNVCSVYVCGLYVYQSGQSSTCYGALCLSTAATQRYWSVKLKAFLSQTSAGTVTVSRYRVCALLC